MAFTKVSAIVRSGQLEAVEQRLQKLRVPGISVTEMKGFGEYANFFNRDWFSREVTLEIFVCEEDVDLIVRAIIDTVRTGTAGDGLIAVLPVDEVFRIRTGDKAPKEAMRARGE